MVELLATVTILGILATIATVSVTRTMQKAHKEYDQKQNKLFTTAAQTYFTDNRNALPKKLLTTSEVTLQELIDKNYIEEIVDYKKKVYDKEKSKAYVKKTGAGKYIYYSVLVGSDGRQIKDNLENKKSDDIETVIGAPDLTYTDMKKEPFTESDKTIYYVNKQITIPIKLSSTIGISSYQYKINKLSSITSTGKKYKTSGEIAVDNKSFSDTISINAKDFANGIYQLEIDAYGYQAEGSIQTSSYIIVIDKTKPKCTIKVSGTKGNKVDGTNLYWYKNGNLTATIDITEQNKYQYALAVTGTDTNLTYYNNTTSSEKKSFNDNIVGKQLNGYVIDKAGNKGKCETAEKIYYDPIPPTCKSSGGTNTISGNIDSFVNTNVTITGKCEDKNGSGCKQASVTKNFSESQKQEETPGKVEDKAGNEATCPNVKVYIDKTEPRCIPTSDSTWHASDFYVSATCSDNENGVGCEKTNYSSLVTLGSDVEGTATDTSITVSDKLGNKKQCEIPYYYDTKAPGCVSSGGSDSWTNDSRTLNGTCSDSGSGCVEHVTKLFNTEGSWTNQSPGIVKDNVGHETTCPADQTVKIDKKVPNASSSYHANYILYGYDNKDWYTNTANPNNALKYDIIINNVGNSGITLETKYSDDDKWENIVIDPTKIDWSTNSYTYVTNPFSEDNNGRKRIYRVKSNAGSDWKQTSFNVYIDNSPPTIKEVCMCSNCSYATSSNGKGGWLTNKAKHVLVLKLNDSGSGLDTSTWQWDSNGDGNYNASSENGFNVYKGTESWQGYIGVSNNTGKYSYTLKDVAENSTSGTGTLTSKTTCSAKINLLTHDVN